jgi:hypothetical protein
MAVRDCVSYFSASAKRNLSLGKIEDRLLSQTEPIIQPLIMAFPGKRKKSHSILPTGQVFLFVSY